MAVERSDAPFDSGGERCAAWLYTPENARPHPCLVMAHGFSGVREQRLDAYAERFAQDGIAVLLFDYRHFGASEGEPRQLLDIGRQLDDWRAAVAHARALEHVDERRVALWGTSFSGGHVVAIAAGDPGVAAVVSQAPFTDGLAAIRSMSAGAAARLTLAGIRDELGARLGRRPRYLPAVGPPGSLAAMTSPDAEPGFRALDPPGSTWVNRFTPRVMLRVATYRPYGKFAGLRMPVLVCACDSDAVTPPQGAVRAAERSPNAELLRYPIRHFDVYVDPQWERTVSDQSEFLRRNLVGAPAEAAAAPS